MGAVAAQHEKADEQRERAATLYFVAHRGAADVAVFASFPVGGRHGRCRGKA